MYAHAPKHTHFHTHTHTHTHTHPCSPFLRCLCRSLLRPITCPSPCPRTPPRSFVPLQRLPFKRFLSQWRHVERVVEAELLVDCFLTQVVVLVGGGGAGEALGTTVGRGMALRGTHTHIHTHMQTSKDRYTERRDNAGLLGTR